MRVLSSLAVSVAFLVSCTIWSQRQWDELPDKTFRLSSFVYYNKAADKGSAFTFMKSYPVRDISTLLRKKYGIVLDTTEFESFLSDQGNERNLDASGVFVYERFAWTAHAPAIQVCELEYEIAMGDDSTERRRSWTVRLLTQGKSRLVLTDFLEDGEPVPHSLAGRLGIQKI
ncbi:MAG: hypothetical protein EPN93_00140 [Spirochaetes bacterium]|nr:MAG: hypothetical protein EPN93_00140 [Spirochaetota bacterium]